MSGFVGGLPCVYVLQQCMNVHSELWNGVRIHEGTRHDRFTGAMNRGYPPAELFVQQEQTSMPHIVSLDGARDTSYQGYSWLQTTMLVYLSVYWHSLTT
jgi:hypothetical protein